MNVVSLILNVVSLTTPRKSHQLKYQYDQWWPSRLLLFGQNISDLAWRFESATPRTSFPFWKLFDSFKACCFEKFLKRYTVNLAFGCPYSLAPVIWPSGKTRFFTVGDLCNVSYILILHYVPAPEDRAMTWKYVVWCTKWSWNCVMRYLWKIIPLMVTCLWLQCST